MKNIIGQVPHVKDVRDDFVEGTPSVRVLVDRQKAALFGLTTDTIGFALKTAYNGLDVSSFREGDEDYDITVQLREADRRQLDVLRELLLPPRSASGCRSPPWPASTTQAPSMILPGSTTNRW